MNNYNKLSFFIENMTDSVVLIDTKGIIRLTNKAISNLLGYTKEDLIGKNVSVLMGNPHKYKHDSYIQNYQKTGVAKVMGKGREVIAISQSGKKVPVRLNISQIDLDSKIFYVGMLFNLTNHLSIDEHLQQANTVLEKDLKKRNQELRLALQELAQSKLKLEQKFLESKLITEQLKFAQKGVETALEKEKKLNELKSRFISTASHEFRTPLSSILSSASLMERDTTTETNNKRLKHTNRIKSSVGNLTQILNDFLSLSKLEENKLEQKKQVFDLSQLCATVIEEISIAAKQGQTFDYQHQGQTTVVYSNLQSVRNILINLISNAIKYSKENSPIHISSNITEDKITLIIKDKGIGIPEHQKYLMFDRFFRADNAINIQGTGLGLYIVKKYLENLNGTIDFESQEGKGTTFRVFLPTQKI